MVDNEKSIIDPNQRERHKLPKHFCRAKRGSNETMMKPDIGLSTRSARIVGGSTQPVQHHTLYLHAHTSTFLVRKWLEDLVVRE